MLQECLPTRSHPSFQPTVSIGNVGQLAIDLLLASSTGTEKYGDLAHPALIPLVGSGETVEQTWTSCQVHVNEKSKVAFVQLRSDIAKGREREFVDDFMDWFKRSEFGDLVILSSLDAVERGESQLSGSQFRYLTTNPKGSLAKEFGLKEDWLTLEKRPGEQEPRLYGSGLAKQLLQNLSQDDAVEAVFLFVFCTEGDNLNIATYLTDIFNQWKGSIPCEESTRKPKFRFPSTWQHLYGNPIQSNIY
ncbi:proteasome assembly chaperone 2-like [Tigriopus californicus]|uniref:proteasome assembly chaperone 2-like n=1 Tax=Tigriopus californicus TaxID=6832 RepID=UPI0027DA7F30|nr:proteasome assembly chaperone 2-like [Tigriopus californicus]